MSSAELISEIASVRQNEDLLVITGGEPFRQAAVTEVIEAGLDLGMYVQIESNGTLPPPKRSIPWATGNPHDKLGVYLVVSPKMNHVHADIERVAHAYKYVLTDGEVDPADGLPKSVLGHPTKNVVARPPKRFHGPIYVQPADEKNIEKNSRNLQATIQSAQAFGYTLQLQLHKYLGME